MAFGFMPASIQVDTAKCRSPCQVKRMDGAPSNNGWKNRLTKLAWPMCPPRRFVKIRSSGFENLDLPFHSFSAATSCADSGTVCTAALLLGAPSSAVGVHTPVDAQFALIQVDVLPSGSPLLS